MSDGKPLFSETLASCLARRDNALAAVRILAATAVLYTHAFIIASGGTTDEAFAHPFAFRIDFHGVHAFFILSGLLLTRSLIERPDALRFIVARLVRYMPGILVAALAAAFVVGPLVTHLPLADYFRSGRPFVFVAEVTSLANVNALLPGVFDTSPDRGNLFIPLWTIHYELVFAVILAIAYALGLLRDRRIALAGLGVALAVNVVWFWNGVGHPELGWPHHLVRFTSTFGIGVALALFAERVPVSRRIGAAVVAVAVALAFTPLAALAGMALIAYAILVIGFAGGPLAAALAQLGVWSYGFYVWGYLIEHTLAYLRPDWSGWTVWVAAFPIALTAGALSWRFLEQPLIARTGVITRALRGRLGRRSGAEASVPLGSE